MQAMSFFKKMKKRYWIQCINNLWRKIKKINYKIIKRYLNLQSGDYKLNKLIS